MRRRDGLQHFIPIEAYGKASSIAFITGEQDIPNPDVRMDYVNALIR